MRLPKIETLIIIFFLGAVVLWMVSKCGAKRTELTKNTQRVDPEDVPSRKRDTVFVAQPAAQPNPYPAQQYPPQQPYSAQHPPQQPIQQYPSNTPATNPVPQEYYPPSQPARTPVASSPNAAPPTTTTAKSPGKPATNSNSSTLFVCIDGLKMRKEPGLKGETVSKLELYEPVTFLNQKTEWTQEISLGYDKVTDHWVKVRTKSGKEGWVFGAGVHYYKMKRKGVMD